MFSLKKLTVLSAFVSSLLIGLLITSGSALAAEISPTRNLTANLEQAVRISFPDITLKLVELRENTIVIDTAGLAKYSGDESVLAEFQGLIDAVTTRTLSQFRTSPNLKYQITDNGQKLFRQSTPASNKSNTGGFGAMVLGDRQDPKKVTLSPGHGYYFNVANQDWRLQRVNYQGIVEDFINHDLTTELQAKLSPTFQLSSTRELNRNFGNHPTGYPLWQMSAKDNLQNRGAPAEVWNDIGAPTSSNPNLNRDIRARPLYANYLNSDVLINIHNNGSAAGQAGISCGTETWYDTSHPSYFESQRLATLVQSKLISKLRSDWNPNWCDRGAKGSDGFYGENRLATRPAILIELAFMDNPSDNAALQNTQFRNLATTAIQEAVTEFLDTTVFEAENLTGIGTVVNSTAASNGKTSECNKCQGNVAQVGFVVSPQASIYRLRFAVLVDQSTIDTSGGPNPNLFEIVAQKYQDSSAGELKTQTVNLNSYLAAPDINNDGYKEFDIEVTSQNANYLTSRLVSSVTSKFSFDRLDVLPTKTLGGLQFYPWQSNFDGETKFPVSLAASSTQVYQSHVGLDGRIYTRVSADGITWGMWTTSPDQLESTDKPIGMVTFAGKVWQTHIGLDSRIYTRSSSDGQVWNPWTKGNDRLEATNLQVNLADFDNKLYQTHVGLSQRIYTRSSEDGLSWSNWTFSLDTAEKTNYPVNFGTLNNKLLATHIGLDHKIYTRSSSNGVNWSAWSKGTDINEYTDSPVGLATVADPQNQAVLFQIHRGLSNKIYTRTSRDANLWSLWAENGGSTLVSPSIIAFQNTILESHVSSINNKIYTRSLIKY